jgi:hypothetical protein
MLYNLDGNGYRRLDVQLRNQECFGQEEDAAMLLVALDGAAEELGSSGIFSSTKAASLAA